MAFCPLFWFDVVPAVLDAFNKFYSSTGTIMKTKHLKFWHFWNQIRARLFVLTHSQYNSPHSVSIILLLPTCVIPSVFLDIIQIFRSKIIFRKKNIAARLLRIKTKQKFSQTRHTLLIKSWDRKNKNFTIIAGHFLGSGICLFWNVIGNWSSSLLSLL